MKLSKKRIAALVSVAAVAAFALVFAVAFPQTAAAQGGPGGFDRSGFAAARMAAPQNTYLADALGITVEELQAAQQQAAEAAIDQAVAEGLLTPDQADAIKARSARFAGKMGRFDRLGRFGDANIDPEALLADALGITVEELQAAQQEAQDAAHAQALTDGRITPEQAEQMQAMQALRVYLQEQGFQDKVRSLFADAVQEAVDAGVITQEQADQLLEGHSFGMRGFGVRGHSMRGFNMRSHGMQGFDRSSFGGRFMPQGFAPRGGTATPPTAFSF